MDLTESEHRPDLKRKKASCGMTKRQLPAEFSAIQPGFLTLRLKKLGVLTCPDCNGPLEIIPNTVNHTVLFNVLSKFQETHVGIPEGTRNRVIQGDSTRDDVTKGFEQAKQHFPICTFNKVVLCTERMNTKGDKFLSTFSSESETDKASFSFLTKADYTVVASSQLSMLSYSQYLGTFNNYLMQQQCLQKPNNMECAARCTATKSLRVQPKFNLK